MPLFFARLTKQENKGLVGTRQEGIRQLTGKEPPPPVPRYAYLAVNRQSSERLEGVDLFNGTQRFFKNRCGQWTEYDPSQATRIVDIWGWNELISISPKQVAAAVAQREKELFKTYIDAQRAWMSYVKMSAPWLEPSCAEKKSSPA